VRTKVPSSINNPFQDLNFPQKAKGYQLLQKDNLKTFNRS
jgi:hypothetical protein